MKKIFALCLTVVLSVAFVFSGCSSNKDNTTDALPEAINLTVVCGVEKNAPTPEYNVINNYITSLAQGGHLLVVVDDAKPGENFFEKEIPSPDSNKSAAFQKKQVIQNGKDIAEALLKAKPKADETNLLEALSVASKNTSDKETGRKNILVIFDNGIQTAKDSAFPMTDLRLISEIQPDIVKSLKKSKSIPNLKKFDEIIWYGLGQVDEDQDKLPNCDTEALKSLYTKVFTEAGVENAVNIFSDHIYNTSIHTDKSDYPYVTPAKVTIIEPIPLPKENDKSKKVIPDDGVLHINDNSIKFLANSAKLKDPTAAKKKVSSIIRRMKKYSDDIVIIGTTAHVGAAESSKKLSKDRAQTIKDIFTDEGINEGRITVFGAGYSDSDLVLDDHDKNGSLNEKLAMNNRAVNILSVENKIAKRYLNNNG